MLGSGGFARVIPNSLLSMAQLGVSSDKYF
jgi:hypothetical protein